MLLYLIIPLVLAAAGFLYFNTRSGTGTVSVNKSELLKPTTDKKKKKKNKPEKKAVATSSDSDDATEEAKLDTIDVAELYGLNKKKEVVVQQVETKKKAKNNKVTEQKSSKKQKEEDPTFQVVKRPELTGRKKDEKKAEPKVEQKKQKKDENKSIFKKFAETKKDESDDEPETKKKVEAKQAESNSEDSDSEQEVTVQATVVEKKEKRHTLIRDPYVTEDDFWNSNTKEVPVEVVETKPKKAAEKSTSSAKIVVNTTSQSTSATWNQKEEGKAADESNFPKVGAKKTKK